MSDVNDINTLFSTFHVSPGQSTLAPGDMEKLTGLFQRQLGVAPQQAYTIAMDFSTRELKKLSINEEDARNVQARNDQESRRRQQQSPRPPTAAVPPQVSTKSPFSLFRDRSRSPKQQRPLEQNRSRSPLRTAFPMFARTTSENTSPYKKMHNDPAGGEEHDIQAGSTRNQNPFDPPSASVDSINNISSGIEQFHIGTSPSRKKGSPREPRRSRSDRSRNSTPSMTPASLNASFSFSVPSPSRLSDSKSSVLREPPSPLQQSQQGTKPARRKVKIKCQEQPLPFASPLDPTPTDAMFGCDSDGTKREGAPPPTDTVTQGTILFFSPLMTTKNGIEATFPAPTSCINKKVRDMETPIPGEAPIGFNLGDLKPEGKRGHCRGRTIRKDKKKLQHNLPIPNSHTADTVSSTDASPSNQSSGDMSWSETFSPPPVPLTGAAPAPVHVPPPNPWPQQPPSFQAQEIPPTMPQQSAATTFTTDPTNVQFHLGADAESKPLRNGLKKVQRRKQNLVRHATVPSQQTASLLQEQNETKAKLDRVTSFREQGKSFYQSGDYRKCIEACTSGIAIFRKELIGFPDTSLLGVLFSNRAAALLMVGAYQAAFDDCTDALQYSRRPTDSSQYFEGQPSLIPKLYNRRARASGKLGELKAADEDFDKAIACSSDFRSFFQMAGRPEVLESLDREMIEATNGKTEIIRCRRSMDKVAGLNLDRISENKALEALDNVNSVLAFCGGSVKFINLKIQLLSRLQRWQEVIRACERIGAERVKMDGCFPEDLALKNPLPGVPEASYLKSNAFDGVSDSDVAGVTFKLPWRANGDVVLRLPMQASRHFVRALRLKEDYLSSLECIQCLKELLKRKPGMGYDLNWLDHEEKLATVTQHRRKNADDLFAGGNFLQAAFEYNIVASLDPDSRGLLNAVMYCNRAACFMALKSFEEALNECNKALNIHPRYMKALLRRARCQMRLERYDEASLDFQKFVDYTEQAKNGDTSFIFASPFVFEGPHQVKAETLKSAKEERQKSLDYIEILKQENARRRREKYANHHWQSENFSSNARSRKEQFYGSSERPWDSFTNRGPKRSPHSSRYKGSANSGGKNTHSSKSTRNGGGATNPSPRNASNHYSILGISREANQAEIKRAYRKLVLKFHPDKRLGDPNANDTFRRIQEAYEALNDPATRQRYDREQFYR
ncbi:chaperone protein DNAj [Nitzschia inconspicua]|uniref:Chaperone protein DNAj n=1 Tax=Nitzschia inconspicua TaxID=303405 RepID=A0A9K3KIC8_9STRA|nr:chaperone protein DNAj [Nitzschia inconspicua]